MNRTPPADIRRRLRAEVGFGCPIPGCGIPYLTWHHFDPEWRVERHHRPGGMIALCLNHAGLADGGAYPADYLRDLKESGRAGAEEVRGQLAWMRRRALLLVGGNWYYETPVILRVGSTDAIVLSRDSDGYLLLNLQMPSTAGSQRVRIEENFFVVGRDHVLDVECAARGRTIKISYPNGDRFAHEYWDVESEEELRHRYSDELVGPRPVATMVEFPLTVVEVTERTANSRLEFGPLGTRLGGVRLERSWAISCGVAIDLNVSPAEEAMLFQRYPIIGAGGATVHYRPWQ